ncbi:MAG: NAD-dependent epimerase/dehydratase family protein [Lachnospiraceae bacterium]|nr:NAD-dependent epimerase/dehydratase family protein [Lachnospiraceae bacterium]
MKKVLLIGGSGFIGRNILEYFKESDKYSIIAPSSKELNILDEDKVAKYLQENYFDIVLNFAIYGDGVDKSKDGTKMLEYNLRMFLNFEKNSHFYGKMYYAGSGAEYDKRFDIIDAREEDEGKSIPVDQYGLMRYTVDKIIRASSNIYNLKIFGIFGKYEQWERRFISNCCCRAIKGLPLTIRKNLYFDYLYVEDFCRILEKLMDITPKEHSINVTRGEKVDLYSLAKMVNEISNKDLDIIVCEEGLGNEYTASNKKLMCEIGNFEYTDMKETIGQLYRWYEENEKEITLTKLLY